jgi:hypothetical protein
VPRVGRAVQHGPDLPPDDRDLEQRLLRHVPRIKPEEPPLADRPASCVEPLDPDVVEIAAALHRRPGVGLRQVEQDGLEDLSPDVGRQRREPMRHRLPTGVPQDAEPRSRDRLQHLLLRARYELVLPVAEEREVVVGEPPQEVPGLSPISGGDHRRLGVEVPGDRAGTLAHRRLVRVGGAHVAEDADQVETEPVEHARVGLPVDLDVVEGLPDDADLTGPRLVVEHGEQLALRTALDNEHGLDRNVQAEPVACELGRQGVRQERHVVGHDLHDGVRGGESVLVEGGGEHRDLRLVRRSVTREAQVRERRSKEIGHGPSDEVLGRDPLVVPLGKRKQEPDLLGRHPLQCVLAEALDDSRSVIGRHRIHGPLLPVSPEGSRFPAVLGSRSSSCGHRPYRARSRPSTLRPWSRTSPAPG